jgi:hypothetical protein
MRIQRTGRKAARMFGLWFALACILASAAPAAQEKTPPTISFTLDFPGSQPEHYEISVSSDGGTVYDSSARVDPETGTADPFHLDFVISKYGRQRIFDLARQAHYFEGTVESKKHMALTGRKTLRYKDGERSTQATYNYSSLAPMQELTEFFQSVSTTLELGHRLQYFYRFQKLALDAETKRVEEADNDTHLKELSAIAPILEQIANDPTVVNVARARALRLCAAAKR